MLHLALFQWLCAMTLIFAYIFLMYWPSDHRVKRLPKRKPVTGNNRNIQKLQVTKSKHIIVWWTSDTPWMEIRMCPGGIRCDVYRSQFDIDYGAYLFYGPRINFTDLPLPRRPKNIIWGLSHEESPRIIPVLMYEKVLNLFNYSSTYSRYSDVPFPLLHVESLEGITSTTFFLETTKKNLHISKGLAPVLYIQSNCDTSTERDDYLRELMKHIDIDSYGDCLNNKRLPDFHVSVIEKFNNEKFLRFVARYKFTLAIENAVCNDYITEKLWRPISVGSVPIYFGSPTVRDWLPNNKSAILLEDYRTPKALSEHLKKVLADDKLYEEYLEHKLKGFISNQRFIKELLIRPYQTKFNKVLMKFECFICEKLHNRKGDSGLNIVNRSHYDCPKPISAKSQKVNPLNKWVRLGILGDIQRADKIYDLVSGAM